MPNVNLVELETCLETLLAFLERNVRKSYAAENKDRVEGALDLFRCALRDTDVVYNTWRVERADGKLAYKLLHRHYVRLQRQLEDEGAMGWPEQSVEYYLEEDSTMGACREMREYLARYRQQIDFADEEIGNLDRLIENAGREVTEAGAALSDYRKLSGRRKSAMEHAIELIKDLRPVVRRDLGVEHPEYYGIKWPAAVSPDPM